jgi:hypothetical protein
MLSGGGLKTIQQSVGHKSMRTTYEIYLYTTSGAQKSLAQGLEKLLRNASSEGLTLSSQKGTLTLGDSELMSDETFETTGDGLEDLVCSVCGQAFKLTRVSSSRAIYAGKHEPCGKSVSAEPSRWVVRVFTEESES